MRSLYKFYWDCGRMGVVDGIFVADEEEVKDAIGKEVYFGEILGKHSEVFGTLKEHDLTIVSQDIKNIEWLLTIFGAFDTISGYNPLEYISEDEDEDWG